MPTYDYVCAACGHHFEAFHGMNAQLSTCPACGQENLRRRIGGGAGLIFKGKGFYQTDYKSGGTPAAKEGATMPKPTADVPKASTSNGG